MLNVNYVISRFRRPDKGFDPIPYEYALKYCNSVRDNKDRFNELLCRKVLEKSGSDNYSELTFLDLGAGPGQYSAYFAELGMKVFHQDVSLNFIKLAMKQHEKRGLDIVYHHNYMENSLNRSYDIIFSNVSYYYCFNDRRFAQLITRSLKENGIFVAVLHNENRIGASRGIKSFLLHIQFYLNEMIGLKLGHPPSSVKRIIRLFKYRNNFEMEIKPWGIDTLFILKKL